MKDILTMLNEYWIESSQKYAHNVSMESIRISTDKGLIRFEPKVVDPGFQEKRMATIRNMFITVLSVLVEIFDYDSVVASRKSEFPEGPEIIDRGNQFFNNPDWMVEETT